MLPTLARQEPYITASCLPIHPRTPSHLRTWTRVSRARADDIMMSLSYGYRPSIGLEDMRCIRDMTGDRTLFDIEVEERVGADTVVKKFPVSQYAYASAYCLYLEGQQEHYLRLSAYGIQLNQGTTPSSPTRALAALETVTRHFSPIGQSGQSVPPWNPSLQELFGGRPAAPADAAHFQAPAPPPVVTAAQADDPLRSAVPPNRRQRRLALQAGQRR